MTLVLSASLRWMVMAAMMLVALAIQLTARAGDVDFRLLAGTGSSGTHPHSLVELLTGPPIELPVITNTFYLPALDTAPNGQLYGAYTNLCLVDLTNNTVTSIGTLHTATDPSVAVVGMAFAPDGALYAVIANTLCTIDTNTCLATEVGPVGIVYGIDFAPDGRLFGGAMSLYQLDPATGQVLTNLGSLPSLTVDFDFAPDGFIYGVTYSGSKLLRINPENVNESAIVGTYESSLRGIASTPLPEIAFILAECLDATNLTWRTGGDADWFGQSITNHDGFDAAQSGAITHNQTNWIQTTVQGPGILSFWWKVSCEGGDGLEFAIDGVQQDRINYSVDWTQLRFAVPGGNHTFRWTYAKNYADYTTYLDAGWVDEVEFTSTTAPVFFEPPHSLTALWGDAVSLDLVVCGVEPLSYQWRSNGVALTGQTNAAFTLDYARTNDNAMYSVVITNSFGSLTSAPVTLQVLNLQMDWQRTLGGDELDSPIAMASLPDGGWIACGSSFSSISGTKTSTNYGRNDIWLTRLDATGQPLWDRDYGDGSTDSPGDLCLTDNGEFVLVGSSYRPYLGVPAGNKTSLSIGRDDAWFSRVDASTNKSWDFTYGGTEYDSFKAVRQTGDGGFILAGYSQSPSGDYKAATNFGGYDFWVVRVSTNGTYQWDKSFGGSDSEIAYDVRQTSDGGFLVGGYSSSPADGNKTCTNYGAQDVWLVRLDSNGDWVWDKSYGGTGYDSLLALSPTADGGCLFVANSSSEPGGNKTAPLLGGSDFWVVRLDASGTILWQHTYGGAASDSPRGICPASDGGYYVYGSSYSDLGDTKSSRNFGYTDAWLVHLNAEGQRMWDYSFGGTSSESLCGVDETCDGGLMLLSSSSSQPGGNKSSPNLGSSDFWFIKLTPWSSEPASFSLSATWTNGSCLVNLLGAEPGHLYQLQVSDDLVHWQDWETVTNTGGVIQRLDASVTNQTYRFYRATRVP